MTSTKLNLDVLCVNEWAEDYPTKAVGEISAKNMQRITRLATIVRDQNVSHIAEFEYSLDWMDDDGQAAQVQCSMLIITKDCFYWETLPGNCGDDFLCRTSETKINTGAST